MDKKTKILKKARFFDKCLHFHEEQLIQQYFNKTR
jgi:hypothetical protein